MATMTKTANAGECKCLGWCGKTFFSPDKTTIRFCTKCRSKKNNASESMSRVEMRAAAKSGEYQVTVSED